MIHINLSGIIKSSLIDFPGLVSCVLFVPGCNYSCFYCHNRSLIDGNHIILTPQSVTDFLRKRAGLLDGVVISGGEPTLQSDLISYIRMLKDLGYRVKLDTNGSRPDVIKELLKHNLCDYFAVDYKVPAEQYQRICGQEADAYNVIETIRQLAESDIPFEVRTTLIPQLKINDLRVMAKEIPPVPRYVLNRYKIPDKYLPKDEERIHEKPYTADEIKAIAAQLKDLQPNITV
ncbi:MAG: anaerobic ribonucleoside-triphosphate reductase activating protein [Eubacteriales bacterium]|nr:anaerobic ribonucleoside-triphosphate reductase activating protein [Eubacteriales bacterium]MDD4630505.1 anaerobic ribonucleoside-triphosphate reductase activating protein [Eubacteriales bacterium]